MNSNCLLAFTKVMTHDRMKQSYAQSHYVLQWFIADTISTETGTTGSGTVQFVLIISLSTLQNFISFKHGPGDNYVTDLCNFVGQMVCVCVCMCVCEST